ncbi:MAG: hypothetical protein ACK56I_29680, partial [bacterium]
MERGRGRGPRALPAYRPVSETVADGDQAAVEGEIDLGAADLFGDLHVAVAEFGGPAVVEAVAEAAIDLPRPVARLRAAPVGKAVEVPAVADVVSD